MSPPPILIPLVGGLGNQLFQLSFGLYMERILHRKPVFGFVDTSPRFTSRRRRQISIQSLLRETEITTMPRVRVAVNRCYGVLRHDRWITEEGFRDEVLTRVTGSTRVILGYFQNVSYVDFVFDELERRLRGQHQFLSRVAHFSEPYLAVHLRFGDYLSSARTRRFHGLTTAGYYRAAVHLLLESTNLRTILAVSDDLQSASRYVESWGLPKSLNLKLVSSHSEWDDLSSLSGAHAIVCSNSSFSWWGAYLASKLQQARVVVPIPWFTDPSKTTKHLFRPGWTELPREFIS